jgi:uncharacterized flavoprotein (TIGR03862 family)
MLAAPPIAVELPGVAVIGAGPAGLMAAEVIASKGVPVDVYDSMASAGRKFLLAGRGGLNLTHDEPSGAFADRYAERRDEIALMLARFGATELRAWAMGLGVQTFVGSSGRVFPVDMKSAPLLRAWLHRLRGLGVRFHMRHRWVGWAQAGDRPRTAHFICPEGNKAVNASAIVLALGGASWPRLGSDGAWTRWVSGLGIGVAPLRPSNCGFDVGRVDPRSATRSGWSEHLRSRHAGSPVKNVALRCDSPDGRLFDQVGEFVVTEGGVEGALVYAASACLRESIAAHGSVTAHIDLLPARSYTTVLEEVARPRGSRSLSTHLKSRLGLDGVKAALLHEVMPRDAVGDPQRLAAGIKALPLTLVAPRPIDEAISSAGGVGLEALDERLMCRQAPGLFCAGEMLDWEAPTGGYLLTACLASGVVAGEGVLSWLDGP